MSNREIVIGTRGSKLALIQTQIVVNDLKKNNPDLNIKVHVIQTSGDRGNLTALGAFVGEIEKALLEKKIDIAVHSFKDMPAEITAGLRFSAILKRADAREVFILKEGERFDSAKKYKIGTGSPRRSLLLNHYFPHMTVVPIRGNVDSRIGLVDSGELDGVILAAAGLIRIGMSQRITKYLPVNQFIPAPGQGALAVQTHIADHEMRDLVSPLDDKHARLCSNAEHIILKEISGGCSIPLGAFAECLESDQLKMWAFYGSNADNDINKEIDIFHVNDIGKIPRQIAQRLKKNYKE